ncbi:MAG: membrane integrity-associated transporter subunit PqiC [Thermodesulfobacteria bacterium]|nr:membrane integrity-associated transporter subunit PqiC [Thermodesulfobacteriota bacterium]
MSPPSPLPHYYLLQTVDDSSCPPKGPVGPISSGSTKIIVGPISLPPYLDRSQIVQLVGENRLRLLPTDLWAEPLDEAIERVLSLNLTQLSHGRIVGEPFSVIIDSKKAAASTMRLLLKVYSFEAQYGNECILRGKWQLFSGSNSNSPLLEEETCLSAPLASLSAKDSVECMSELIEKLSYQIVKKISEK